MLEKFPIPGVHEQGGDGVFAVVIDYCFIWFLVTSSTQHEYFLCWKFQVLWRSNNTGFGFSESLRRKDIKDLFIM